MSKLYLGSVAPVDPHDLDDGTVELEPLDGLRVTSVVFPDDRKRVEAFAEITSPNGVWSRHSAPGDDGDPIPPAWVDGDDDVLVQLVAEHYGCKIGAPESGFVGLDEIDA